MIHSALYAQQTRSSSAKHEAEDEEIVNILAHAMATAGSARKDEHEDDVDAGILEDDEPTNNETTENTEKFIEDTVECGEAEKNAAKEGACTIFGEMEARCVDDDSE
eukprot:6193519-Pleurochrysis_carterae.AAC.4